MPKKFNERSLIEHVPIELFQEFLEPYRDSLPGLNLGRLSHESVYDFLLAADETYPAEMIEVLHKIDDIRRQCSFERIVDLARDRGVLEKVTGGNPEPAIVELILRSYLFAKREVFDWLWDEEYLHSLNFSYDRRAAEIRPLIVNEYRIKKFETAFKEVLRENLKGEYCNIRHYEDTDGHYFVIRHGWQPILETVESGAGTMVIGFRPIRQDVIHYDADNGKFRLKCGSRKIAEKDKLRDIFAEHLLGDPNLFRHEEAENLYTLEPIRREGVEFEFRAGLLTEDSVVVTALKVARGEGTRRVVSHFQKVDGVLGEIAQNFDRIELSDSNLISARFQFRLVRGGEYIKKVVEIRPPSICVFSNLKYSEVIWDLLGRNGFLLDGQNKPLP